MAQKTSYLQLITYHTTTDSACPVYDYINNVAGSMTGQNPYILDTHASNISASLTTMANGYIQTSSSYVGAPVADVSAGMSNTALMSASGLAHSLWGKRTCVLPLNKSYQLRGVETNYILIPDELDGWCLVEVYACCNTPSSSGSPTFSVEKRNHTSTSLVNMLERNVTIDQGEYDSIYSSTSVVISSTASSVFSGYTIKVSNVDSGSGVLYSQVSLTFENIS